MTAAKVRGRARVPAEARTQAERREGTVRKILDAATDVLAESGYAGASTQRIAERAGVSAGGLFRHFPTRETLMVAVGEDVAGRLLARYERSFQSLRGTEEPVVLALELLRKTIRTRTNAVWLELVHACRTEPSLRRALTPVGRRYAAAIERLARELLPDLARGLGDDFGLVVHTIVAVFDGEQMHRMVFADPAMEKARVAALAAVARALMERSPRPRAE